VGTGEGASEGCGEGASVGSSVGVAVGSDVGTWVGSGVGAKVGSGVGSGEGSGEGSGVGAADGSGVGAGLGSGVGSGVGSGPVVVLQAEGSVERLAFTDADARPGTPAATAAARTAATKAPPWSGPSSSPLKVVVKERHTSAEDVKLSLPAAVRPRKSHIVPIRTVTYRPAAAWALEASVAAKRRRWNALKPLLTSST
jgi:hypothetical protein